jgi:hypothetical protein
MTVTKAHEIHEAWKRAGSEPCNHGFVDGLESNGGVDPGITVCAICGSHSPDLNNLAAVASAK